jgi:hypothetical protein
MKHTDPAGATFLRLAARDQAERAHEASPIRGTHIARTGIRARDLAIQAAAKNSAGNPVRFPYDESSDAVLEADAQPGRSDYTHHVAESVREHRRSFELGHNADCRPELVNGFCH